MKLHIDGVEQEVPGIEIDNGVSLYVDASGVVRATRTVQPPKSEEQLTPHEREVRDLRAQLAAAQAQAAPPPPPDENEN
jgi:hypothetical protein